MVSNFIWMLCGVIQILRYEETALNPFQGTLIPIKHTVNDKTETMIAPAR